MMRVGFQSGKLTGGSQYGVPAPWLVAMLVSSRRVVIWDRPKSAILASGYLSWAPTYPAAYWWRGWEGAAG